MNIRAAGITCMIGGVAYIASLGCGKVPSKPKLADGVQHDRPVRVPLKPTFDNGPATPRNTGKNHPLAGRSGGLGDLLEEGKKEAGTSKPAPPATNSKKKPNAAQGGPQHEADTSAAPLQMPLRDIDEAAIRMVGIRKITGKHIELFTDLPSEPEIEELPAAFDAAFAQWCEYFKLPNDAVANWQLRASLMDDKAKFTTCDLLPTDLPNFLNGYTRDRECWLNNQTSPYYRRHLLLHEGVHGLMFSLTGSNAPSWYLEGIAELLATHRWQDGKMATAYFPQRPEEVAKLGRIEIVQNDFAKGLGKHLAEVLAYDNRAHLQMEPYGWSWAAAAFLDGHPRYRERFRGLQSVLKSDEDFNARLRHTYADDAAQLAEEWQVFIANVVYGYDFARNAVDFSPGKPLTADNGKVAVAADRGWQNAGIRVAAGQKYQLTATGQFQVATQPKPWVCEPSGLSIRYIQGKPIGLLVAAVRPDDAAPGTVSLLAPIAVGNGTTLTPTVTGTLFFKVNDSPGELGDNSGTAMVEISAM